MIEKVNLAEKFAAISQYWKPGIVGELNDVYVKLVRIKGEFVWHRHDDEDELFLVLHGSLEMRLRDGCVTVNAGEFIIVPRAVEHCPIAREETHVLLVEPKTTRNTGNVQNERTVEQLDWI